MSGIHSMNVSEAKELNLLKRLEKVLLEDNYDSLRKFISSNVEDQVTLRDCYHNVKYNVNIFNLVILACKHNKVYVVEHLLDFCYKCIGTVTLPNDEDGACHYAFYYAIRSGSVELLNIIISKWPKPYFPANSGVFDKVLSRAYEELKLKNVPLSEEIELSVEKNLIDLRFISNVSNGDLNDEGYINNTNERIDIMLLIISVLKAEYSNTEKVDDKFLFITKFIAQNIHILKQQSKETYDRLPWEEMEFCLICFISSHIKRQEINIFYRVILNKSKILNYLETFAKKLVDEKDFISLINKFSNLPKLSREAVITTSSCEFIELYRDYQQIRDIHSLNKISDYLKLALLADPKQREGQLVIRRVLQVTGEYLKNTLESPKLSSTISELLLLSLPKNKRHVIIELHNSLSHAYSLSKITEIEENADVNFFIGVQNECKTIDKIIIDIVYYNKIKMIRILLTKITNSANINALKEAVEIFSNIELDKIIVQSSKVMEDIKIEKLIKELSDTITDKTNYEKELFNQINNIMNFVKCKSENTSNDYIIAFLSLWSLTQQALNGFNYDRNYISLIKCFANKTLKNIVPKMQNHNLKEIVELSMIVSRCARLRLEDDNLDKINRLVCEIVYMAELGTGDRNWIHDLRKKFNENGSFTHMYKERKDYIITEGNYNNQLALKLSELNSVLQLGKLIKNLSSYKKNKTLQAVLEILVLDIMSILEKRLENNILFLDDNAPLLNGKCLHNHLAHADALVDVLLSDPAIAVILNAEALVSKNIMKTKGKIGELRRDDPTKLKDKYGRSIITITNQRKMFTALEEGNVEEFQNYLKKGADINARSNDLLSTLHFAAKGPSLEIIKFLLKQNLDANVKDINGQTPLHIAAAHGRKNIVEYFIREAKVHIDLDYSGKTPLHIAARNGHKDIVEVLLNYNANTNTKYSVGVSLLYNALENNLISLDTAAKVDMSETIGGFTLLHIAAERGDLVLVDFLLRNGANVDIRNYADGTPLHTAALNGHREVVKKLIDSKAAVNLRAIDGCTPFHYAIENGREEIADILLKHGAKVDIVDKILNNSPLHYAAKFGHEKILKALLVNDVNANVASVQGMTPLHFAVQSGHLKIVAALLRHGVNKHAKDACNATSLHHAIKNGHKEIAEFLIKNELDINGKTYDHQTPLHLAALNGYKYLVELLIRNQCIIGVKDIYGNTPLHSAARNGNKYIIELLINNRAEVVARNNDGMTPLHIAAVNGHKDAVDFLIRRQEEVNPCSNSGFTPINAAIVRGHTDIVNHLISYKGKIDVEGFCVAVKAGHWVIVKILLKNGANINAKVDNVTPLHFAITNNRFEIVEILIKNGASVNGEGGEPLYFAVLAGYRDIVEILLKHNARVDIKYPKDVTLLHLAAANGHKETVNDLITRGASVDAMNINNSTPLYLAAQEGHEEVVEILIVNGANVNVVNIDNSPLHIAAGLGHVNVVEVLLRNGANVNVKDIKKRTALELAVGNGHLQVVKVLLQYTELDIDAKGNDGWTLLHIASQESNLKMIKFLVDIGSNINAKNTLGSKPIHIAAREGFKDAVEFFLSKGSTINEFGIANQTLLHYAVMGGQLEVAKYLILQGADVNAKDDFGVTPMHVAAKYGYNNFIEMLLESGAVYNVVDKLSTSPLQWTNNKDIINLLASTEKLFESAKQNMYSEVEQNIRAGAFVNAKNADEYETPLHYAAWKGFGETVNMLLQNKANPNVVGITGCTPIHYAALNSHLETIKALLFHGAVYNAVSISGKTPLDLAKDEEIINLLELISDSFKKVEEGNAKVINDLNEEKGIDRVKLVMNARNRENRTLVVAAIHNNFSKSKQLDQICQNDVFSLIDLAKVFLSQGNYQRALRISRCAYERRKKVLGPDNLGRIVIQSFIADVLCKQESYEEALNMFEEIFQKQKEMLGLNDKDTLRTRSAIAFALYRLGKDEEAFNIYKEVYQQQKEILGSNHSDTLDTQFHMALVLDGQEKYEEELNINKVVYNNRKITQRILNLATVNARHNIAMLLAEQGKYEESIKIYKEVYERKKMILGINHIDTLRSLHNIAGLNKINVVKP